MAVQITDRARTDLAKEREQHAAAIAHDMAELGSMMHGLADLVGDQRPGGGQRQGGGGRGQGG